MPCAHKMHVVPFSLLRKHFILGCTWKYTQNDLLVFNVFVMYTYCEVITLNVLKVVPALAK